VRSTYCTAAHSKFLRDVCGDEATRQSITEQPDGAALAPQELLDSMIVGRPVATRQ